ncbi:MAG: V-type ATP synthase subunit I [Clostridiales bacterium]|nr:V-type ATP synthase subunit I [Clostridiales bacterium]
MSIAKMKKIRVVALSEDKDQFLKDLMHLGCIQIVQSSDKLTDPQWAALLTKENSHAMEFGSKLSSVTNALAVLKKYAPPKRSLFIKRSEIKEQEFLNDSVMEEMISVAEQINDIEKKISSCQAKINRNDSEILALKPWESLDQPLDLTQTKKTSILLGICPSTVIYDDLVSAVHSAADTAVLSLIHSTKEQQYIVLLCHKSDKEQVLDTLRTYAFSLATWKDAQGTAAENIERLTKENETLQQEIEAEKKHAASFADRRQELQVCQDRLNQEISKENAKDNFLTTGTVFFLEGWVEVSQMETVTQYLQSRICAYEFHDPEKEDTVPTKLVNSKLVEPMNMVTEMYSLPAYDGIDPNPLIFGFFIFFFGFMFADLAYGIMIAGVSLFIWKKYRPKGTMGYMFRLGVMLGISTAICGILTGSFFGDAVTVFCENFLGMEGVKLPSLIDPMSNPTLVLAIALVFGVVQMIFGMCVKLYMGFRDGEAVDSILDVVPWWMFFAGLGLAFLTHNNVLLIVSVVVLVLTQGRKKKGIIGKLFGGVASLYDVTSWLSDFLSYSRLMALMLATSVIASVVNKMGSLAGNMVIFIIVFIVGHIFNVGINLIGTYVHAARLQYLEFFGKFYKEGGVPFRPLHYDTKYVDIVEDK